MSVLLFLHGRKSKAIKIPIGICYLFLFVAATMIVWGGFSVYSLSRIYSEKRAFDQSLTSTLDSLSAYQKKYESIFEKAPLQPNLLNREHFSSKMKKSLSKKDFAVSVVQPYLRKRGSTIDLTFQLKNSASHRSEGYVWSAIKIQQIDGSIIEKVVPPGMMIAKNGKPLTTALGESFSIQNFKIVLFSFSNINRRSRIISVNIGLYEKNNKQAASFHIPITSKNIGQLSSFTTAKARFWKMEQVVR